MSVFNERRELTISDLPVEILYRILDSLDIQTICFSIRYVCQQFYRITNSYNRYRLDFSSISQGHFRWICRLIPMENIISLILSDEDRTRGQIQLFLSLCSIDQLTRLRSLTLIQIDDTRLNIFIPYILTSSLQTLSLTLQTFQLEKNHNNALAAAIAHRTLRDLYLNIGLKSWNDLSWPSSCTLHYLRLVNSLTLKHLCLILAHSPCLKSLVLKEISTDHTDDLGQFSPFKQLTSLIFEDGHIQIAKLDQCLALTPSLTYLKLIGDGTFFDWSFDGFQWETILQTRLPSLRHLQFFFSILTYSNYRSSKIDHLINTYRTPFWLDQLHCSIMCDHISNSRKILLYTLPVCQDHFVYYTDWKKTSRSNFFNRMNANDMDDVRLLEMNLTKDMNIHRMEQVSSNNYLFRHVQELKLGNDGDWPEYSLRILSTIVDLSHLVKLSLSINFIPEYMFHTISQIQLLFNQACHLHSLMLYDYWTPESCSQRMKSICSMITPNIKHLQIRVKDFEDIKYLLQRLEHLTSVTFEYAQMLVINRQELIQALTCLNRYSSTWDSRNALYLWFGNRKE